MHDSPAVMLIPLIVLSIGAVFSGIVFKDLLIGFDSSFLFWGDSIKFLEPLSSDHPPGWFLILTPLLVILSIPLSYLLFIKDRSILDRFIKINLPLYTFLKNKWYFDELYEFLFVRPLKFLGKFFWKQIDGSIIDRFGPDGISHFIKKISMFAVRFQSGFIYQYAFIMLLGFSLLLTFLIIK